jgi:hypothetical protein
MRFMVRSQGRDLNGWGVSVTVDIQDISLGNNSGAPFRKMQDQAYTQPTGANIKSKLRELVEASQNGDLLFFHFSGHGGPGPVWTA